MPFRVIKFCKHSPGGSTVISNLFLLLPPSFPPSHLPHLPTDIHFLLFQHPDTYSRCSKRFRKEVSEQLSLIRRTLNYIRFGSVIWRWLIFESNSPVVKYWRFLESDSKINYLTDLRSTEVSCHGLNYLLKSHKSVSKGFFRMWRRPLVPLHVGCDLALF